MSATGLTPTTGPSYDKGRLDEIHYRRPAETDFGRLVERTVT